MSAFAEIILPLPLANTYTYLIPEEIRNTICKGMRVIVPVQRKFYTGIVFSLHDNRPSYSLKNIAYLLEDKPLLNETQLKFWKWIADYYQCSLGEVYKAAIPAGLKLESETLVKLNDKILEEYIKTDNNLTKREQEITEYLKGRGILTIKEIEKPIGIKNVLPSIKQLLDKQIIEVTEKVERNYKPKTITYIRLNTKYSENISTILAALHNSKKQAALLTTFVDKLKRSNKTCDTFVIEKKDLLEQSNINAAILNTLVEKEIFIKEELEVQKEDKCDFSGISNNLNTYQKEAIGEIKKAWQKTDTVLLHGVTSSGKTEIYIHLIQDVVKKGKQVLFLLPEIALTTQITNRLRKVFGDKLGVYHSKFSDAERIDLWHNLLNKEKYDVIVGVRSSIFLPLNNLGLIIIDEEHESSYKQYDPAPRYHARDAALMFSHFYGIKTLLGTATPSFESYYNVINKRYGLVEIKKRHKDIPLPNIEIVDIKDLRRKKMMKGLFSPLLIEKIKETLDNKEQVILFQNRRGYAPFLECNKCGYIPKCNNCDVSLTKHKKTNVLSCHYCGYTISVPQKCPNCKEGELVDHGFGTERIEEEVVNLFPMAKVQRMDLDTTRSKNGYETIIREFEDKKIDILIGTQMISKGLDFEHVNIVGILNVDNILNFPDFRAYEKAFQLIIQVSGRAGRSGRQGNVILQTSDPENPIIKQAIENNFQQMFQEQMEERRLFKYPPYYKLIYISLKHPREEIVEEASKRMAVLLVKSFGNRILGPENPPISRIQRYFIKRIILKIENNASQSKAKEIVTTIKRQIISMPTFGSIHISIDVDPM